MARGYSKLNVGAAFDDRDAGTLISNRQKKTVENSLEKGNTPEVAARWTICAQAPPQGSYVNLTLFVHVPHDHVLAGEEVFAPVQVVLPFEDEVEALLVANSRDYGLVASVWTKDGARQMRFARVLRAGQVFANNLVAGGGVELPFGGSGLSVQEQEKGFEALYGFSCLKTLAALHG